MKVLVVSHSYSVEENRKNIRDLQRWCDVKVALPDRLYDPIHGTISVRANKAGDYVIYNKVSLPRAQYLLVTGDLGMKQFAPDIIHIEYDPWSVIFWQVALYRWLHARRAKLVCTVKKNTYRRLPWPLEGIKNAIARLFISKVAHFIAISDGARDIYVDRFHVSETDLCVMQHLGLDLTMFTPRQRPWEPVQSGVFVIGYCGRLDADKGIEDLLAATDLLAAQDGQQVQVRLLGNGELRQKLCAYASENLKVLDPVPHGEVAQFLRAIDIFVLPSRIVPDHQEHDAHALLEALACGVPSIGSSSGIIPQILQDGCGLVFEAGDVAQMKERLRQLINDRQLRRKISQHATQAAKNEFSTAGIAQAKYNIYKRLVA